LRNHSDFFSQPHRVLDIGPAPGLARAIGKSGDLNYVTVGIDSAYPKISAKGDITELPFADGTFDVVLCQHVLEHVEDDRRSLSEIRRVLRNDGWAVISVPIRPDQATLEDPSVTDPEERTRLFGEPGHVRFYGYDLADRIKDAGLDPILQPGEQVSDDECRAFGLRKDENLFLCHPSQVGS
jgi:SAM-dependent methyltransferase